MRLYHVGFRFLFSIFVAGSLTTLAHAGNWSADFDSPLPASWVTFSSTEPVGGTSATFSGVVDSGYLRLSDSENADSGGSFAAFGGTTDDVFTDVTVGAIVNVTKDTNDDLGVVARGDTTGNAYFGNVDFELGQACIAKVQGYNRGEDLVCSALGSLDTTAAYHVELSATGGASTALTLDVFDETGSTLVQSISATDDGTVAFGAAYESGISGVYMVPKGTFVSPDATSEPINGTFDNVFSVPEPGTASLLLLALSGLLIGRRRNR